MSRVPCPLVLLALVAAAPALAQDDGASEADARIDDDITVAIEHADGHHHRHRHHAHGRYASDFERFQRTTTGVFFRFFNGLTPNETGVERPTADERALDDFEVPLGDRFSYVLAGSANDHVLTDLHFLQVFEGVHALRWDLLRYADGSPFRIALTGSPLYGSVTLVTRHAGVYADERLPQSIVVGGAGGLDAWWSSPLVEVHARSWALPGVDLRNEHASGVETIESLAVTWRVSRAFQWDVQYPLEFVLVGLHVERGDARHAVYAWSGDARSPSELRDVWQGMALLQLRLE